MPEFAYVAQREDGAIERGAVRGAAPADVREHLSRRGLRLVGIRQRSVEAAGAEQILASLRRIQIRSIRSRDIVLMLQQLSVMLESGLELTHSLRELSEHAPRRAVRKLCHQLAHTVEQGQPFAAALKDSRSVPEIVSQLAHVGEETGKLSLTLQRASEFLERRRDAIGNLVASLAYPAVVAMAACAVAVYLVGWAIPKLAVFLKAMGRSLPTMTQSLLDLSAIVRVHGPQLAVILITAGLMLAALYAWRPGRYRIDQILLRIPAIGRLIQIAETHQFASCVALMLRSGVFLQDALQTASTLHRNQYLAMQVVQSRNKIAMGKDFASTLAESSGFSSMLPSMAAVGQQTGDLPRSLDHVAKFYASQLETSLKRLGRMIEPTIIIVVGSMVGYVYVAFFMALLSAGGNFK